MATTYRPYGRTIRTAAPEAVAPAGSGWRAGSAPLHPLSLYGQPETTFFIFIELSFQTAVDYLSVKSGSPDLRLRADQRCSPVKAMHCKRQLAHIITRLGQRN